MEILWLIIGFIIGLLVAWFYLGARHRKQSAEREAELRENSRQAEEALAREENVHAATRQRMSELETQHASARERADSLTGELKTCQENLRQAKAAGGESRELQERLVQRDADIKRLESDLADCRAKAASAANTPAAGAAGGTTPAYAASAPAAGSAGGTAPAYAASAPAGGADDLTKIKGIGQVLKGKLNRLGITTFKQIAEFTDADIERVNAELDFPGRIERERWVEQARDFARR
jgi:predicted flap endonuclease-1-like 5' DNA nuclease